MTTSWSIALAALGGSLAGLAAQAPAGAERLLTVTPSPAMWAAGLLYGAAAIAFGLAASGRAASARTARIFLALAVVAHGIDIGWRGVEHVHPAESVREALGFLAWIIGGGLLWASLRWRIDLAGTVISPVVIMLLLAARLTPPGTEPGGLTTLGRVHITLATVGVAIFALASALAAVYLVEDRGLKRKRFDTLAFRSGGAPLEKLDALLHRLVWLGFPIFTAAMILGVVWVAQRNERLDRPEYPLALVTWTSYAALLVTRTAYGWRGRRTARLTLIGFGAALMVLAIYLMRRIWGG